MLLLQRASAHKKCLNFTDWQLDVALFMRGNTTTSNFFRLLPGSSPLTRGIPSAPSHKIPEPWFTPAHVGNTRLLVRMNWCRKIHPRPCGEYSSIELTPSSFVGSPPPMRGIPHIRRQIPGFIWVHPRPCGEYEITNTQLALTEGSPPPMRGIRRDHPISISTLWFTPAHAGNTQTDTSKALLPKVHPRPCGEYILEGKYFCSRIGSPPPMRGIQCLHLMKMSVLRFTPAHAGNTAWRMMRFMEWWVHPRPCGEYQRTCNRMRMHIGSPPPMRGIRNLQAIAPVRPRFTPAHAGNTLEVLAYEQSDQVHPRPCGEYLSGKAIKFLPLGSPPPMRGIRWTANLYLQGSGFTPAHAGNTKLGNLCGSRR